MPPKMPRGVCQRDWPLRVHSLVGHVPIIPWQFPQC